MRASNVCQWLSDFFSKRGLTGSTGKPLYTYGLADDEYDELKRLLNDTLRFRSSNPFYRDKELAGGYLLFAAAQISREYTEGAWRWNEIDRHFADCRPLLPSDHEDAVRYGAQYWQLQDLIQTEGKKYLGFVMLQAGIPMNALATASGWAHAAISDCLRFMRRYPETSDRIVRNHIESQIRCPDSFDKDIFCEMVFQASQSLRQGFAGLPENPDADDFRVACGKIRPDFPAFRLDEEQLQQLYTTQLPDDDDTTELFSVRRFILWNGSESAPKLILKADLKKRTSVIGTDTLRRFFPDLTGPKSGAPALFLLNRQRFLTLAPRDTDDASGGSYAVLQRVSLSFTGAAAAASPVAVMNWAGGATSEVPFGNLEVIDPDEPMLFVKSSGAAGSLEWRAAGTGSVSTPAEHALLLCRQNATVTADDVSGSDTDPGSGEVTGTEETLGISCLAEDFLVVAGIKLALYEIRTSLHIHLNAQDGDGDASDFVIRLHQADAVDRHCWFNGNYAGLTDEGWQMFRGVPDVYCNGIRMQPFWRLPDGRKVSANALPADVAFPVQAVIEEDGATVKRMRCVILPEDAHITRRIGKVRVGNSLMSEVGRGEIRLENWGLVTASTDNETITVAEEPQGVRFICPSVSDQNALEPFTVFIAPRSGARCGVRPFSLTFDYPQSILAFKKNGVMLPRDADVSLADVRDVEAYAVTGTDYRTFDAYLQLQANCGPRADFAREHQLEIPLIINPNTASSTLRYDDFRAPLFRLMRFAGIHATVSLRICTNNSVWSINVTHENEVLHYIEKGDLMSCNVQESRTLKAFPVVFDPNGANIWAQEVLAGGVLQLGRLIPDRDRPWIMFDPADPKYRLRPVLVPPSEPGKAVASLTEAEIQGIVEADRRRADAKTEEDGDRPSEAETSFTYEAKPEHLKHFRYLAISNLWQRKPLTPEDRKRAEQITLDILTYPKCPEWDAFQLQWMMLKRRGLAYMPYWKALSRNVPLALALAVTLDIVLPKEPEDRSLVFSLGRYKSWRWDFVSVPELISVVKTIHAYLRKRGDSSEKAQKTLLELLMLDAVLYAPVFRKKLAYALLMSGCAGSDFASLFPDGMDWMRDPYLRASKPGTQVCEALKDMLIKDPSGVRGPLRGTEQVRNAGEVSTPGEIERILEDYDPSGLEFVRRCGVFSVKLSESPVNNACMRTVILADFAWARGYALKDRVPELLQALSSRRLFFNIESAYEVSAEWSVWAAGFASAMVLAFNSRQDKTAS